MFNCFILYLYRVKTNIKTFKSHKKNWLTVRKITKNKILAQNIIQFFKF